MQPASPSPDDSRAFPVPEEAIEAHGSPASMPTVPAVQLPKEQPSALLGATERPRNGPLRLLDLPVDILKEVIHQVSMRVRPRALSTRYVKEG